MLNISDSTIDCSQMVHSQFSGTRVPTAYGDLRICFVSDGKAQWLIDDKRHDISKGDIVLLHNRQKRYFTRLDDTGFRLSVITLKRQAFYPTTFLSCFLDLIKKQRSVINDPDLLPLLKDVTEEYAEGRPGHYEMMAARLTEFFVICERRYLLSSDITAKINADMVRVLDFIDSGFKNKITLDSISAFAGMTPSSFSRWFSNVNGISFKRYLMIRRIEYAVSLLESGTLNTADIAYECGFTSLSGFYDAFKKITGTTPGKA